MTFAEARQILLTFEGGDSLRFLLAMSGTPEPLEIFVRAAAARCGRAAEMRTLPFNTLAQALHADPLPGEREIFLLFPWDFVPEADWRSGFPTELAPIDELRRAAERTSDLLRRRHASGLLYVPAPLPPLSPDPAANAALAHWLAGLASSLDARILPGEAFSLGVYLAAGCPIGGAWLPRVATAIAEIANSRPPASCKVLVTDLDNVVWTGVVAEDGVNGIAFAAEGSGYPHFIYQSLLAKLQREGVVLCAVSRNDPELAVEPLRSGRMLLREESFVAVIAGYHAKSAQLRRLADRLNLGLDSFVFIDDNPVELAEVAAKLPEVRCVPFPKTNEALPAFCDEVARLFAKRAVTAEDAARTELYRRRLATLVPSQAAGSDLTTFLRDLQMKLTIREPAPDDRTRAVQLINKTTQFNLNGRRVTDDEVGRLLARGGRLYTAALEDRSGSHGEILACLISAEQVVTALAMSCRVFQRRIEYAFCAWLAAQPHPPRELDFAVTPRNEPIRQFLSTSAVRWRGDGPVVLNPSRFTAAHADDVALFALDAPSVISRCA